MRDENRYYNEILKRLKKDYDYKPGDYLDFGDDYIFTAPTGLEFALSVFYPGGYPALVIEYAEEIGGQRSGFGDGDAFYIDDMTIDEMYQKIKAEIEDSIRRKQ